VLIFDAGKLVRTRAAEGARVGRNTQGVTLIRLPAEEALVGVVRIEALNGDDEEGASTETSAYAPIDPSGNGFRKVAPLRCGADRNRRVGLGPPFLFFEAKT